MIFDINLNVESTPTRIIKLVGRNKQVLEFGRVTGYMRKVLKEHFGCEVIGLSLIHI